MFRSIPRPSAAMVIACLALAVALSGGIIPGDGPYIVVNMPSSDGSGWLVQTARATSGYSALVGRVICANVS